MLNVKSPGRMKQVLNKSGSSLVWVAVTMVVLLILIGGILTMATIYHHSSVKDNSLNQAYFSARSAVDAVTTELQTQPNGKLGQAVADLTPGTSGILDLGAVDFGNNQDMGSCQLRIFKTEDKIAYVEATATVGDASDTVVGILGKQTINDTSSHYIPDYSYFGGGTNNLDLLYASGLYFDASAEQMILSYQKSGDSTSRVEGNIYSKRPLHITGTNQNRATAFYIGGSIYSDKYVAISDYTTVVGDVVVSDKDNVGKNLSLEVKNNKPITIQGTVKAGNTTISGNGAATIGSVAVNSLTVEKGCELTVNGSGAQLTATKVVLDDGVAVTANVTCDTLEIGSGATVKGNVICNNVVIKSLGQNAVPIQGDLKVYQLTIGNSVYHNAEEFNQGMADINEQIKYVSGTVTFNRTAGSYSVAAPDDPVPPHKMSGFGNPSDLEAGMLNKPEVSQTLSVGVEGGNDSYYLLESGQEFDKVTLDVHGTGNIYIYVAPEAYLGIRNIKYDRDWTYNEADPEVPNLYIVAMQGKDQDGGEVEITRDIEFYGYLYGEQGGTEDESGEIELAQGVKIYGGLFAGKLDDADSLNVHTIPFKGVGEEGGGTYREQWYIRQYLDKLPKGLEG